MTDSKAFTAYHVGMLDTDDRFKPDGRFIPDEAEAEREAREKARTSNRPHAVFVYHYQTLGAVLHDDEDAPPVALVCLMMPDGSTIYPDGDRTPRGDA